LPPLTFMTALIMPWRNRSWNWTPLIGLLHWGLRSIRVSAGSWSTLKFFWAAWSCAVARQTFWPPVLLWLLTRPSYC